MEAVEKVDFKKHHLEETYEKLVAHLHEMKKEDFDPQTIPEEMVGQIEKNSTQKCGEAEDSLTVHEYSIMKAERMLSLKVILDSVALGPPKNKDELTSSSHPALTPM